MTVRRRNDDLKEDLAQIVRSLPWWAISFLVHLVILLILAHWEVRGWEARAESFGRLEVGLKESEERERLPVDISANIAPLPPAIEPPIEGPSLPEINDTRALAELGKKGSTPVFSVGAFDGRTAGGRLAAVEGGGGATKPSENAVELGLAWLARRQLPTGAWSTADEKYRWANPAVSALATLAFLGAGYTHRSGKYMDVVERALGYLKSQRDKDGCIAYLDEGKPVGLYMYGHGMGTLALVEAYGMTKDVTLRGPAQHAIDFICQVQNSTGAWRYYGHSPDGDSSISGWMVMALRSASLSGLDVPAKAFPEARRFFDSVTDRATGTTYYMPGRSQHTSPALDAVGLLCHQYLGLKADDPYVEVAGKRINQRSPQWVNKDDPSFIGKLSLLTANNNYYFWYYANLALHQRRGQAWEKWHPQVRDLLCKLMEREGKERGSWSPQTYGGTVGGRVFSTAMAILSLEVYYRYAPMYRDTVDEVLAAFGDALSSYNHFLRLHEGKKPEADDARQAAIEKLRKFLALSETRPEKVDPRPTLERRNQAAKALVQLHHAGDEIEDAIALLATFPQSFPGALAADEQQKLLADLYRARARQLADASKPEEAKQAEATALKIYYPLVTRSLGRNPEIELWMAQCFFQSGQWEDALEFYRAQVKGVALKKLDPKSEKGQIVAAIYNRMIECCEKLKRNKMAAAYLQQLEELLGQSVATLRRRADLYRKDDQPAAARKIYEDLVQRLPRYSKEWWETTYDYLFMAYLEGRRQYVAKAVHRLQDEQPELGGEPLKASFLELLRRAEGARPQGEAPPTGAS